MLNQYLNISLMNGIFLFLFFVLILLYFLYTFKYIKVYSHRLQEIVVKGEALFPPKENCTFWYVFVLEGKLKFPLAMLCKILT